MTGSRYSEHSAKVEMHLLLAGHRLRITHMGPDFLLLKDTIPYPVANAEISLSVDGQEDRWTVHLPNGLKPGQSRVLLSNPEVP